MNELHYDAQLLESKYISLRRRLHERAETACHEFETANLIVSELKKYGIETQVLGTSVIGILHGERSGKTVILRSDIDALPIEEKTGLPFASKTQGVCHACGHDLHVSAMLLTARLLSTRRDKLRGTVRFLFQSAEETLSGARELLENSKVFDGADAIFAEHTWPELPVGCIGVRSGAMMASADSFEIKVQAKGGHAAHPERTADTVLVASEIVSNLHTIVARELPPIEGAALTVGELHAGTAPNIIPAEAVLRGTIRSLSEDTRKKMKASIERITEKTAECFAATASVRFYNGCPALIGEESCVALVRSAARWVVGEQNVVELPEASLGSEDFAWYLQKIPGALFRLGTADSRTESQLGLHNSRLVFNEQAIRIGATVLCSIVIRFTESEEIAL